MIITWKVSHFLKPIEYESGPTTYGSLGISFVFEGPNISGIDHEFAACDNLSKEAAAELSTQQLALVWELIWYRRGYPAQVVRRAVVRLGSTSETRPSTTNFATITGQSAIVHRVCLPEEKTLLSDHNRLKVWLRLANDARRPTSSADAIRNYYMILEDMHGRPNTAAVGTLELKFIRDFVSHGEQLTNPALLAFLQRELGTPTNQYDPHNSRHKRFLEQRREWAMRLAQAEIDKYL